MRGTIVGSITLVMVAVSGVEMTTAAQGDNGQTARASIEAAYKIFSDCGARKDAACIAGLYTEDAEAYPANSEAVKGRQALQGMWKSAIDSGITRFELTIREVQASGESAIDIGNYVLRTTDGTVADRGNYMVLWKRVGGRWLMHRDMWTTSLPAPK